MRLSCSVLLAAMVVSACGEARHGDPTPVPVVIAIAQTGTARDTLTGLGHVEGAVTVTVHAQVAGQLLSLGFAEGRPVTQGQVIAKLDPRPLTATLAQDEAVLARDLAVEANARDTLVRNAPLEGVGIASAQQVAGYRAGAAQAAAAVAGDRAAIMRDRLTLAYATIRAPIAGMAGIRMVDPGNIVSPTDSNGIVTISRIEPANVVFALPQAALASVQAAMAGGHRVSVDALGPDGLAIDSGVLSVLDNRVDPASGMVLLKAGFPNRAHRLWPGAQISARVVLAATPDVIRIPASALQSGPSGAYVWVVGNDNRAGVRPVTPGSRLGETIVITHGLSGGERVVSDGQFGLVAGARVAAAPASPMARRHDDPARLGLVP
ncbi:efflux RND transporter periplasmic adaptor subunit [Novosphingobium sp. Fuku2-ISO-50]|uniref:efflux RND transporter periplasmic adaptor subunit n=1 Tax=Novosphingobium sp. Fuku2-ISO-50 TaxID=1739114 RepID=UPI0009EC8F09|nr:efflux RND transporter periplasmic adaptor subunit [Novosphingobium sp. Fuku2-ISO-50]